jgi:hypothetical protein
MKDIKHFKKQVLGLGALKKIKIWEKDFSLAHTVTDNAM